MFPLKNYYRVEISLKKKIFFQIIKSSELASGERNDAVKKFNFQEWSFV